MKTLVVLGIALGLVATASADESFRCGKWVVNSGMSIQEFTTKCGQPTARSSKTEDVMVRNRNTGLMEKVGETTLETWTYDRGSQAQPMVLTIVDGRIKSIDRSR
jgi:uncharacterized protein DUF2845